MGAGLPDAADMQEGCTVALGEVAAAFAMSTGIDALNVPGVCRWFSS